MYSPVPITARKAAEDQKLPSKTQELSSFPRVCITYYERIYFLTVTGGYIVPEGAAVHFVLIRLHNDENYFKNPSQFIPERFDDKENITKFSYLPFGAGLRNCIG